MGSELGRSHGERFQDYHQQPHRHLHLHPHPRTSASTRSYEVQDAIQRELEKSRIREEIIMSEIMRRRMLESEVRRELMMERELALRLGGNGFSSGFPSVLGFDFPLRLPAMGLMSEERLLDERNVLSLCERERLNGRGESGWSDDPPFQRGTNNLRVSEVKSASEAVKEKEKIIFLAKPVEISGTKRKAVTPSPAVDASEHPTDDVLKKRAKEEWSCALCQVSATSERGLNDHLEGKKHKARESKLKAKATGKNPSKGVSSKKDIKSSKVEGSPATGSKLNSGSETDDPGLSQKILGSDGFRKNHMTAAQTAQKSDDPKKKRYKFWCEMCQVGANSEKVMDDHKSGKKHTFWSRKSNQIGGADPSDQNEKTVDHEDGDKNIASDKVGMTLDESRSTDHVPKDAVKQEDYATVDENEIKGCGTDDTAKLDDDVATEPDTSNVSKNEPTVT